MTQEYTPTDNGIAHYAARGMDDIGICSYDEAKRRWGRWLAAHDAQIREDALSLTDEETNKLSEVLWNYVEDVDLDAATGEVKSTLETIAKTRMEQKQ